METDEEEESVTKVADAAALTIPDGVPVPRILVIVGVGIDVPATSIAASSVGFEASTFIPMPSTTFVDLTAPIVSVCDGSVVVETTGLLPALPFNDHSSDGTHTPATSW